MRAGAALVVITVCIASVLKAQGDPMSIAVGQWHGAIDVTGTSLPFSVAFLGQSGELTGTIDIQGARALPLRSLRLTGATIHFELPAGPGVAVFDGTIGADAITGKFSQGGASGTFHLVRDAPSTAEAPSPPPYHVENVTFTNGDIRLAGTLTTPTATGPFPAVVMVTGSGAQNRDEELFGFRIFGVIADHLTRHGIAVLRYDDRGVGGSTGDTAASTLSDYAEDALAGIAFLGGRRAIDRSRIGIFGHSEGGTVGAMAATRSSNVAFVVMMAAPAIPGEEVLARQQADGARALGAAPSEVAAEQAAFRQVVASIRSNASLDVQRAAIRGLLAAQYDARSPDARAALGEKSAFVEKMLPAAMRQLQSPEVRDLIALDPAPVLAKVPCPVLALFGGRDTQVPLDANRPALEAAFAGSAGSRLTVRVYPDANHLFIRANTGQVTEYPTLPKVFVPGFLDDVTKWVQSLR